MNEIEELAKKHLQGIERLVNYTGCDSSEVDSYKTELKHLIELVENEQISHCSNAPPSSFGKVSEQIDWEEL